MLKARKKSGLRGEGRGGEREWRGDRRGGGGREGGEEKEGGGEGR